MPGGMVVASAGMNELASRISLTDGVEAHRQPGQGIAGLGSVIDQLAGSVTRPAGEGRSATRPVALRQLLALVAGGLASGTAPDEMGIQEASANAARLSNVIDLDSAVAGEAGNNDKSGFQGSDASRLIKVR